MNNTSANEQFSNARPGYFASILAVVAVLTGASILLGGCDLLSSHKTVDVNVSFIDAGNVAEGTPVNFGGTRIGVVKSVSKANGDTKVVLSLDGDKAGIVKNTATAMVGMGQPVAIVLDNPAAGAESVTDGATLRGIESPINDVARHATEALNSVQKALQQAASSFQGFMEGEEWRNIQRDVQTSLNELSRESATAADEMRKGVEDLMRDLESESGDAIRDAEKEYKKLQDELRNIGKESKQDVIDAMQELLDSLKEALDTASEHKTQV